jgi:hypothetical protein
VILILFSGGFAITDGMLGDEAAGEGQDEILEGLNTAEVEESAVDTLEDILGGFDDPAIFEDQRETSFGKLSFWDLTGSFTSSASYNFAHNPPSGNGTDYRGLSRWRQELQLDLDLTLSSKWDAKISGRMFHDFVYGIRGRDNYTDDVLDQYENEAEIREAYIQGRLLPSVDIKFGRQIVVWGKSDNIRVTDVLNPLDNREPGMVDIENLRLPVTMTRLDYYFGDWNLSCVAVHEIRFNKEPVFGSDFFPLDAPPPFEEVPENSLKNTELGAALKGIFSGWDLSVFIARFFDDQAHVEQVSDSETQQVHSRLIMTGAAANIARGNWLLKTEAAYLDGLEFTALDGEYRSRLDLLGGFEYSGFSNTMIALEVVNRHLVGNLDSKMEKSLDYTGQNEIQSVLRYQRDFLNETVNLTALVMAFGATGKEGALQRISVKYDLRDALSVTGGMVVYQSGRDIFFEDIGGNDRLFLEARYSF